MEIERFTFHLYGPMYVAHERINPDLDEARQTHPAMCFRELHNQAFERTSCHVQSQAQSPSCHASTVRFVCAKTSLAGSQPRGPSCYRMIGRLTMTQ